MASWVAIVSACPGSGHGHHVALRCRDHGPREPQDFARLVASRGADVRLIGEGADSLDLAVLRAELHAGPRPCIVVMDRRLVRWSPADDDDFDRPSADHVPTPRLSSSEEERIGRLRELRNTYVWRWQAGLLLDSRLAAFFGGAVGPIAPTREWRDAVIALAAPGIGVVGTSALAARVADPRGAAALAAMASVAASALDIGIDEAAVLVAGSLSSARSSVPAKPIDFDARLVVCDEEGQLLLARAGELALHGGRVLFWGPPGGGKSTFAQALAAAMGRGAQTVTGASVLARHWGVTERIIADVWSRAAANGDTLIIDEIDSLCGAREPGASSGNAYLVRTSTNEFLRAFDTHASVPVLATANHLEAIDEAVRRRFTFVIHVSGELPPELEALAWRSLLRVDPPSGWTPIGGVNASDFANAARRCSMLGLMDATSLAAAVERSRDARLGPRSPAVRTKRPLQ
jgi:hypothetical protein